MRQALLNVLRGKAAGRVVWTADITYWISGQPQAAIDEHGWDTEEGMLSLCRELGCMPYYWYPTFWAAQPVYDGAEIRHAVDGPHTTTQWITSRGTLTQVAQVVERDRSTAITKHAVETAEDLRVLLHLLEHGRLEPCGLEAYAGRMARWEALDGLPALGMPRSPLPAFLVEWAGVERGVYLMLDFPDLVEAVLGLLQDREQAALDALCRAAPPLVHFPDNLTSAVYTPFFDRLMADCYRGRLERLHAAGVRAAVHLDGTVRGLLPKLAAVGMDAIEALTPRPAGDVAVEDMRAAAGNRDVVLWGGVPGVMFAPPYTREQLRAHVVHALDSWRGTPFVLGVADQVPPDGELDRVRLVADTAAEWAETQGETDDG
jgi:hypothetical protein